MTAQGTGEIPTEKAARYSSKATRMRLVYGDEQPDMYTVDPPGQVTWCPRHVPGTLDFSDSQYVQPCMRVHINKLAGTALL